MAGRRPEHSGKARFSTPIHSDYTLSVQVFATTAALRRKNRNDQERPAAAFHASSRLCCPFPAEAVDWRNAGISAPSYRRDSADCSMFTRPSRREHAPEKLVTMTRQIPSRRRDRLLLRPSPFSLRRFRRVATVLSLRFLVGSLTPGRRLLAGLDRFVPCIEMDRKETIDWVREMFHFLPLDEQVAVQLNLEGLLLSPSDRRQLRRCPEAVRSPNALQCHGSF